MVYSPNDLTGSAEYFSTLGLTGGYSSICPVNSDERLVAYASVDLVGEPTGVLLDWEAVEDLNGVYNPEEAVLYYGLNETGAHREHHVTYVPRATYVLIEGYRNTKVKYIVLPSGKLQADII